jgi:hypothetical protein
MRTQSWRSRGALLGDVLWIGVKQVIGVPAGPDAGRRRLQVILLVSAAVVASGSIVATAVTGRLYLLGFCGLVAVVLLPLNRRRH